MNTQKGLATILLIFLVVVFVGSGFYFLKTKPVKNNTESVLTKEVQNASSTNNFEKDNARDKSSFNSRQEQSESREKANGVYDYKVEKGILFVLDKEDPNTDKYKLPITISGHLSENGKWRIFEGEAGVVEIYGLHNGIEGLEFKIATTPIVINDEGVFNLIVGDRQWMSNLYNENGFILIQEPGAMDPGDIDSIKIPIVFDIPNL